MHHELTVAEKIGIFLDQTFSIEELGKIETIVVGIGKMAMVNKKQVTEAFDLIKRDSNFSEIDMELITDEINYSCTKCGREFLSTDYELYCSECGGKLRPLSGDEIYIKNIKYR